MNNGGMVMDKTIKSGCNAVVAPLSGGGGGLYNGFLQGFPVVRICPSPFGRRWCVAPDEGFIGINNNKTLIRLSVTFSQREKELNYSLFTNHYSLINHFTHRTWAA
ncbi:MAG: hypothetical protein LBK53_04815 [Heliobacteriaceae bacterium]|jgi:hypothetical protein|nr:hypothetical protein [Heliobacteriaceae bacterium]